ncbi:MULTISPECIES: cation:proton antiporter [Thioalkalivibrio]|uniref:cation:proton antiporter n=1 Tax=Thioalkalivibrio TaxID=106633 RepID=UPI000195A7A3|nr:MULTISPECIES: monovalent cation/H(+) antiporter subunit G [Thioalkalivibrio]ADC71519.1 Na+/H+ antiporter subunit [Thioalkalivibrio sp. K90mix]
MIANTLTVILILAGLVFFAAGTAGLLRFPDVYSRLHALTKADNVGLGLVILGLMLQAGGPADILKLFLIWVLVLAAGTTAAHMVAQRTWTHGEFESDR